MPQAVEFVIQNFFIIFAMMSCNLRLSIYLCVCVCLFVCLFIHSCGILFVPCWCLSFLNSASCIRLIRLEQFASNCFLSIGRQRRVSTKFESRILSLSWIYMLINFRYICSYWIMDFIWMYTREYTLTQEIHEFGCFGIQDEIREHFKR